MIHTIINTSCFILFEGKPRQFRFVPNIFHIFMSVCIFILNICPSYKIQPANMQMRVEILSV